MTPVPFLIEAQLDSPLILSPEAYLTLDSLLSAAYQLFGEDGQPLPLKNTDGVFHGSAVMMAGRPVVNEAAFVSRMTIDDFSHPRIIPDGKKKMAVKMTSFPDKPRLDRYQAFHVPAVAWFASGDPGKAIALLRRLPGLGKRCHSGYGQVSAYSVTEMAHDHAWVLRMPPQPVRSPSAYAGTSALIRDSWSLIGRPSSPITSISTTLNSALCQPPVLSPETTLTS